LQFSDSLVLRIKAGAGVFEDLLCIVERNILLEEEVLYAPDILVKCHKPPRLPLNEREEPDTFLLSPTPTSSGYGTKAFLWRQK